jgi:hypothetical protein
MCIAASAGLKRNVSGRCVDHDVALELIDGTFSGYVQVFGRRQ